MTLDTQPAWKIWMNPIFQRYATARVRMNSLLAIGLSLHAVIAFLCIAIWLYMGLGDEKAQRAPRPAEACALAWIVILSFQGLILLVRGTFAVATGIAQEAADGMVDYIRLTPPKAWTKVIGCWLGLPSGEWLLALSLTPWMIWATDGAHVPVALVVKVYLIVIASALFHHAVGLVAGTVIKQKILAGTVSQLLVVVLHFVLPSVSKAGLGPLGHLELGSALMAELRVLLPSEIESWTKDLPLTVPFFRWEVAISGYVWTVTVAATAVLLTMLARRWREADATLLSPLGAVGVFGGVLLLSLGDVLPRLESGAWLLEPLKRHGMAMSFARISGFTISDAAHGIRSVSYGYIAGFAGSCLLAALCLLAASTRPLSSVIREEETGRWYRWSWLLPAVLSALGAVAWSLFTRTLTTLPEQAGMLTLKSSAPWAFFAALVVPLLLWRDCVALYGGRGAMNRLAAVWILPLMIAMLIWLGRKELVWPVLWVAAPSGLALSPSTVIPFVDGAETLPLHKVRFIWPIALGLQLACWFWVRRNLARAMTKSEC